MAKYRLVTNLQWTCTCLGLCTEQNNLLEIMAEKKKAILQEFTDPKLSDFIKNIFILCSENEQRSYRFETTWGWVINDRIVFLLL